MSFPLNAAQREAVRYLDGPLLVLAGAGVRAGMVYGASDNSAAYPTDRPHDPKDMAATIYHLLGVNPQTVVKDRLGRPYSLVIGRPIEGILA